MLPGIDTGNMSSSLGARRPAASNLPALTELPPPPIAQLHNKYQAYGALSGSSQPPTSVNSVTSLGNLLTPPNSVPGDSANNSALPVSSAGPSYAAFQQQPQHQQQQQHQANSFWAANGLPSSSQFSPYSSGGAQQQWIPPRGMFSPTSLDSLVRSSTGMMQNQQYELAQLPPFSSNAAMSAPVTLPAMSASQQMQALNSTNSLGAQFAGAGVSQVSPMNTQESYVSRPPSTPSYFNHHNPQQSPNTHSPSNFPYTHGPTPALSNSVSPTNTSNAHLTSNDHLLSRTTSLPTTASQSSSMYQRLSYGSYTSPTSLGGSMTTNMHNPHNPMAMMGGMGGMGNAGMSSYNTSHSGALHGLYSNHQSQQQQHGHHTPQHPTPTDRPFKCDSCPQSFNRNHDLKRHKRIHLAVKPYPCGHCDKSFSRKDALKRHILVKGCGKTTNDQTSNGSKSESVSPTTIPLSTNMSVSD